MNLNLAIKVTKAAIAAAKKLKVSVNIAVVDEAGNLVSFVRQDGAWVGSINIVQGKAWTAIAFSGQSADKGLTTEALKSLVQPGEALYGIQTTDKRVVTFEGGLPIYIKGKLSGGVGISGATVDIDKAIAESSIKGLK